jgi:hypothetical protein
MRRYQRGTEQSYRKGSTKTDTSRARVVKVRT